MKSIYINTKENYYGAQHKQSLSLVLVLSKILFGPFIAASIVLLPTYCALGLGAVLGLNVLII